MAHYEPSHQDLCCLQIQLFLSLVIRVNTHLLFQIYNCSVSQKNCLIYDLKRLKPACKSDDFCFVSVSTCTIKILSIGTDRSEQTVQTQIRLLLKEQSDQGLHCLPCNLHLLDSLLLHYKTKLSPYVRQ